MLESSKVPVVFSEPVDLGDDFGWRGWSWRCSHCRTVFLVQGEGRPVACPGCGRVGVAELSDGGEVI